jgi:putative restriction endonuclease
MMMLNGLKMQYYRVALLSIKRRRKGGVFINAKPILLLAFFDLITHCIVKDNKFLFGSDLLETYNNLHRMYEPNRNITPCEYPFYHLPNDGFATLTFVDNCKIPPRTPSAQYLRENVKYVSLDNALWDLLQDNEARTILGDAVINYFLTHNSDST